MDVFLCCIVVKLHYLNPARHSDLSHWQHCVTEDVFTADQSLTAACDPHRYITLKMEMRRRIKAVTYAAESREHRGGIVHTPVLNNQMCIRDSDNDNDNHNKYKNYREMCIRDRSYKNS